MQMSIGMSKMFAHLPDWGVTGEEAAIANMHSRDAPQRMIGSAQFCPELLAAHEATAEDDLYKMVTATGLQLQASCPQLLYFKAARVQFEKLAPLSLLRWIVEHYDHAVHHPMIISSPVGFNQMLMNTHASRALAVYGDVALARKWTLKLVDIYENTDIRTDPSLFCPGYYGSLVMTNSFMMKAGLGDVVLRYMKASHLTFAEADDTAEVFYAVTKFMGFVGETHKYSTPDTLAAQMKRRHWLLAPGEVGKGAMEAWLKTVPAECGTAAQGKLIDCIPATVGYMTATDCADVFESLERYEEGITAAQVDIKNYEIFPVVIVQSNTAIGRCQAKLGRPKEATAAFQAAIVEAHDCELPFLELLARRDFIVHVLDAEGRREEQMAGLGDAISRMVMAPGEYTAILGSGIDAEAAVAAFAAAQESK
jgi:hypothetical protein